MEENILSDIRDAIASAEDYTIRIYSNSNSSFPVKPPVIAALRKLTPHLWYEFSEVVNDQNQSVSPNLL